MGEDMDEENGVPGGGGPGREVLRDPARLAALAETGLMDTLPEAAFDRVTRLAQRLLGADVALLTLVDGERQFFKSQQGLMEPFSSARQTPLTHSFCQHVVRRGDLLAVEDARANALVADNLAIRDLGVVAYLGVPLRVAGQCVGALAAVQHEPRAWTEDEAAALRDLAETVASEIALRRSLREVSRVQAALQASEEHHRMVAESASDGVVTIDEDSRILYANARTAEMFGHSREQLEAMNLTRLMPEYLRYLHEAAVARYLETGHKHLDWESVRVPGLHAQGHEVALEISFGEYRQEGRVRFTGILRDVSARERAEVALRESQRRLNAVLSNTTAAIFLMDERQHCVYMNAAAEALTGYTLEETRGRALHDVLHHTRPDGSPYPLEDCPIDRAFPANHQTQGEEVFVHKDGSFYPVAFTASPIREDGRTVGTVIEVRDIRAERATHEALRESEKEYRAMFEISSVGKAQADIGTRRFLRVNAAFCRITGYSEAELLGMTIDQLNHPDDEPHDADLYARLGRAESGSYQTEKRYRRKDGGTVWVNVTGNVIHDEAGRPTRTVAVIQDVTEEKRVAARREAAERALRESEAWTRSVLESITDALFTLDRDWRFTYLNPQAEALLQQPAAALLGTTIWESFAPAVGTVFDTEYHRAMRERRKVEFIAFYPPLESYFEVRAYPFAGGLSVYFTNVSERLRAETALRESEARFRAVQQATPDGFMIFESVRDEAGAIRDFRWAYTNPAAEGLVGRSHAELQGKHLLVEMPGNREEGLFDAYVQVVETGEVWRREFHYAHEGMDLWFRSTAAKTGDGFAVAFTDITTHKRLEAALQASEAHLAAIFEQAAVGLSERSSEGRFLRVNDELCRILGRDREEVLGLTVDEVTHPGDLAVCKERLTHLMETGEPVAFDKRYLLPDGSPVWVSSTFSLLRGADGTRSVLAVTADLSARKAAEAALLEQQAQYEALIQATAQIVWERSAEGAVEVDSPTWRAFTGQTFEETRGFGWMDAVHPDDRARVQGAWRRALSDRQPLELEYRLRHHTDAWRWAQERGTPLLGPDGRPRKWVGMNTDIHDRKQAEETLRRQAEMLRLAHDAIFVWQTEDGIETWNRGAETLYGFTEAEARGRHSHELLKTAHPEPLKDVMAVLRARGSWEGELRHTDKAGRERIISSRHQLMRGEDGRERVLEINRDITENRRAEAALRESEARARLAVQLTRLGTWRYDAGTGAIQLDERMRAILGEPEGASAISPERLATRLHPEDRARVMNALEPQGATHFSLECRILRDDGEVRWISANGQMHAEQGGMSVVGTALDITERKRAEQQVAGQSATLEALAVGEGLETILATTTRTAETLLPGARASVLLADAAGRHLGGGSARSLPAAYNAAIEGIAVGEGVGSCGTAAFRRERVIVADTARDPLWQDFRDLAALHGLAACWSQPILAADGRLLGTFAIYFAEPRTPSQEDLATLEAAARIAGIAIFRKQSEEALRQARRDAEEAQRQLRLLVDNLPELAWWARPDGFIDFYNRRWYEYTGTTLEDMAGWGWQAVHHPDYLGEVVTAWQHALATGTPFEMEFPLRGADGEFRWFLTRVRPLRDERGNLMRWIGMNVDIDERRRAAAAAAEARARLEEANRTLEDRVLERTAKLETINRELEAFNYSVSHDLRAPLRGIDGFSQALAEEYGARLDETAMHYLKRIQAAAQRMGELIDDLLDLSRLSRSDMTREPVDLSALARGVVDALEGAHPGRRVRVSISPHLHAVGDRRMLRIALENLLGNAWKFTQHREDAEVAFGAEAEGVYFVRDNGAGFDMAYAGKLFTPFQRLHGQSEFEGSGIGLATVQRVVHRHGGTIWATGAVGEGATFYFTLEPAGDA
jgi:PAS domain S-box-containing protein